MIETQIVAMAELRQAVAEAKFKIFGAQDTAPRALESKELDGVSLSLTTIRGALEQLDNTLQMIAHRNLPDGPDPQAGNRGPYRGGRRVSRPGGSA